MRNPESIAWTDVGHSLNEKGYSRIRSFLSEIECESLKQLYSRGDLYRSVIDMQRYRFGKGEYKYFKYPLPSVLVSIRESLYSPLSVIANEWMTKLAIDNSFPSNHSDLIKDCHLANQTRPTPLILRYEEGGFNTLHQDLYGDIYFPFQVVVVLSQAGREFEGGEFVLTEQLPRAQSKAEVVQLNLGDALIFTTNFRPVMGSRGYYRAKMRHGVSPLRSGVRFAVGIIFHDAK